MRHGGWSWPYWNRQASADSWWPFWAISYLFWKKKSWAILHKWAPYASQDQANCMPKWLFQMNRARMLACLQSPDWFLFHPVTVVKSLKIKKIIKNHYYNTWSMAPRKRSNKMKSLNLFNENYQFISLQNARYNKAMAMFAWMTRKWKIIIECAHRVPTKTAHLVTYLQAISQCLCSVWLWNNENFVNWYKSKLMWK